MGKHITQETRAEIVAAYLAEEGASYADIAERFGCSAPFVSRLVKEHLNAGKGIKPDRRKPPESPWMEHVTPLHKHKLELEEAIERKQNELDAAKQTYRDFLATIKGLMEERE